MSRRQPKYARKVDASQSGIVDGLRACGVTVEVIGEPVDLACRLDSYGPGMFKLVEIKREGYRKPRKDQEKQTEFVRANGIPVVRTPTEALRCLGLTTDELP